MMKYFEFWISFQNSQLLYRYLIGLNHKLDHIPQQIRLNLALSAVLPIKIGRYWSIHIKKRAGRIYRGEESTAGDRCLVACVMFSDDPCLKVLLGMHWHTIGSWDHSAQCPAHPVAASLLKYNARRLGLLLIVTKNIVNFLKICAARSRDQKNPCPRRINIHYIIILSLCWRWAGYRRIYKYSCVVLT